MPSMLERTAGSDGRLQIAFLGFGEAAQAFCSGWQDAAAPKVTAYDNATDDPARRDGKWADYSRMGVAGAADIAAALHGVSTIFSLVTADQAQAAAMSAKSTIQPDALFLDCNSCAPQTKQKNASIIKTAGGRYVDVAIMAPVHPRLHRTPILISGDDASSALVVFQALGMSAEIVGDQVGAASSIKLCRSIMIKGLEALTVECVLVGRELGVEQKVLATLEDTFPDFGWTTRAAHMLERAIVHGRRRAAEMREAADMVEAIGLPGRMARSSAAWQQQIGELELAAGAADLSGLADAALKALGHTRL